MVGTPISHPNGWSFLVGKPMVVGETHHLGNTHIDMFPVEPTVAGSLLRPQAEGPVGTVEGGLGQLVGWKLKVNFLRRKSIFQRFWLPSHFQRGVSLYPKTCVFWAHQLVQLCVHLSCFPCSWGKNHLSKSSRKNLLQTAVLCWYK